MDNAQMLMGAGTVIISLIGVLLYVVGWVGARVVNRLDVLAEKMEDVKGELHMRINNIDMRVVRLETKAGKD